MTDELRVKCLRDNATLPERGIARTAGYDISAASGCVISAHGKGSGINGYRPGSVTSTKNLCPDSPTLMTCLPDTLLMWELVLSIWISGARLKLSYSITLWKTSQSKQVIRSPRSF